MKDYNKKPYNEIRENNIIRRSFSNDINEKYLTWHRDKKDRVIIVLENNDWMIQFDNEIPKKLNVNEELFIPKETFHRVIKGTSDLKLEIIETEFEPSDYAIVEVIEEGNKKKKKTKKDACYYKVRSRYDVWPSAYACVPENTSKALTRDGWKHVDELNIGDEIMTYNIENDELEFKPILNLHRYKDVKTNVVRSGNNGFIFEATDNHKWVVKLPEIKGKRLQKYNRINDKSLIETSDLLANKNNKHLVVSAQYNGGENVKLDKIFKYGTNWVKYILDISKEQRQAWLFSAIVYDDNQQKVERLTENTNNLKELDWLYTGPYGKQSFGFKQKDIEHRDAFLLSAFLNSGLVTWKKTKNKDIYSCHYTSNKPLKNTSNFKLVKENISDVWCPETDNGTWVMMQETEGRGIITITGNSGALVKCRKVGAANWGNKTDESMDDSINTVDTKNSISFEHEHLNSHHGQNDYELGIYEDGNVIGYIDYTIYNNEITISNILVRPDRRREGFGSKLIKKMKRLHPDAKYKPSLKTDLGSKFIHKDIQLPETYAPDMNEIKGLVNKLKNKDKKTVTNSINESDEASKLEEQTDFSKEKEEGLHGWFARQGGKGKSKGWVDCNTCKKDPETGRKKCKSCGRKEGESRAKYPACRPTPSACGTRGKGKKWGKKTKTENMENVKQKLDEMISNHSKESNNYMFWQNLKTMYHAVSEMKEMDFDSVDSMLSDGHGWALDHIATSKDDVEEVYHFLKNKVNGGMIDKYHIQKKLNEAFMDDDEDDEDKEQKPTKTKKTSKHHNDEKPLNIRRENKPFLPIIEK